MHTHGVTYTIHTHAPHGALLLELEDVADEEGSGRHREQPCFGLPVAAAAGVEVVAAEVASVAGLRVRHYLRLDLHACPAAAFVGSVSRLALTAHTTAQPVAPIHHPPNASTISFPSGPWPSTDRG